jgi:hypothetical protein
MSQYDISHSDIVSINKPSYWKVSVSMIYHLVILSVLINLLESLSQYDDLHSDIVSINKPTGIYQSVLILSSRFSNTDNITK